MRRLAVATIGAFAVIAVAAFVADLVREYRQDRDEAKARAIPDHRQPIHLTRAGGLLTWCGGGSSGPVPTTRDLRAVSCPVCLDLAIEDSVNP